MNNFRNIPAATFYVIYCEILSNLLHNVKDRNDFEVLLKVFYNYWCCMGTTISMNRMTACICWPRIPV